MATRKKKAAPVDDCIHHWRIAEPNGPDSQGRCSKCHKVRFFKNGFNEEKTKKWREKAVTGSRRQKKKEVA